MFYVFLHFLQKHRFVPKIGFSADMSLDISVDISIDILIGIRVDVLIDKEEGRGVKERSGGFLLKI